MSSSKETLSNDLPGVVPVSPVLYGKQVQQEKNVNQQGSPQPKGHEVGKDVKRQELGSGKDVGVGDMSMNTPKTTHNNDAGAECGNPLQKVVVDHQQEAEKFEKADCLKESDDNVSVFSRQDRTDPFLTFEFSEDIDSEKPNVLDLPDVKMIGGRLTNRMAGVSGVRLPSSVESNQIGNRILQIGSDLPMTISGDRSAWIRSHTKQVRSAARVSISGAIASLPLHLYLGLALPTVFVFFISNYILFVQNDLTDPAMYKPEYREYVRKTEGGVAPNWRDSDSDRTTMPLVADIRSVALFSFGVPTLWFLFSLQEETVLLGGGSSGDGKGLGSGFFQKSAARVWLWFILRHTIPALTVFLGFLRFIYRPLLDDGSDQTMLLVAVVCICIAAFTPQNEGARRELGYLDWQDPRKAWDGDKKMILQMCAAFSFHATTALVAVAVLSVDVLILSELAEKYTFWQYFRPLVFIGLTRLLPVMESVAYQKILPFLLPRQCHYVPTCDYYGIAIMKCVYTCGAASFWDLFLFLGMNFVMFCLKVLGFSEKGMQYGVVRLMRKLLGQGWWHPVMPDEITMTDSDESKAADIETANLEAIFKRRLWGWILITEGYTQTAAYLALVLVYPIDKAVFGGESLQTRYGYSGGESDESVLVENRSLTQAIFFPTDNSYIYLWVALLFDFLYDRIIIAVVTYYTQCQYSRYLRRGLNRGSAMLIGLGITSVWMVLIVVCLMRVQKLEKQI